MHILLADDHVIVRSGLRRIVAEAYPDAVIEETGSCVELVAEIGQAPYDLLILDIALGDRNSLEYIPELKRIRPELAIIILSMYGERQFVIRALRAGVLAYLTKEHAPEELIQAIPRVLRGERYLGEKVAAQLADYLALPGTDSTPLHERLSVREHEVFIRLASGQSVTEIAQQLNLSVKTVSTYRNRVLEKMGMRSNGELMRYAMQHSLIS
jgi:DNA-binding NarL/FixJ family response regulator